jgi:hypothetical protein
MKRARDDHVTDFFPLRIGPMPWAERRARQVWDTHVNQNALPACKCLHTRHCCDFGKLRFKSSFRGMIDSAVLCSPLQHGDILEFGESVILWTRVPTENYTFGEMDAYEAHAIHNIEKLPCFRAQDYSVKELALHFVTEESRKKILTEASYMEQYRAVSEAFVYWVLTQLEFPRDMRRYITQRVFIN